MFYVAATVNSVHVLKLSFKSATTFSPTQWTFGRQIQIIVCGWRQIKHFVCVFVLFFSGLVYSGTWQISSLSFLHNAVEFNYSFGILKILVHGFAPVFLLHNFFPIYISQSPLFEFLLPGQPGTDQQTRIVCVTSQTNGFEMRIPPWRVQCLWQARCRWKEPVLFLIRLFWQQTGPSFAWFMISESDLLYKEITSTYFIRSVTLEPFKCPVIYICGSFTV
jgi:hypothetical protein